MKRLITIFTCILSVATSQLANAAADYTITTTGNAIVITDVTGTGETITVTETGGGSTINFYVASMTYSLDGGPTTSFEFPNPGDGVDVPLSGVTSITINAGAGADFVDLGAFTPGVLPSLTVNGGTGDDAITFNGDITFAANANLDVDLQNDNATPGTDIINVSGSLILSGTGAADMKASQKIRFGSGITLRTVNGNLTLEANQQGTPTSGNFIGIDASQANVLIECTGTGIVSVKGKGGNTLTDNNGVQIGAVATGGSILRGGTTGTMTVIGTGGASTGIQNRGVFVAGPGSFITSTGANVSITGQGGGSSTATQNTGVRLESSVAGGPTITAGTTGTVTINGTGGATSGNSNAGVVVFFNGTITSSGGNVSVTGQGGGISGATGNGPQGINISQSSTITAGGSGTVTVVGIAGNTTGTNVQGVVVSGGGGSSSITSNGGNVSVTGTGSVGTGSIAGAGRECRGVQVQASGAFNATISAGGNGTVTVIGNAGGSGASGSSQFHTGVVITAQGASGTARITSNNGNVSVTGLGGGGNGTMGNSGIGITGNFSSGGQAIISAGGIGTVTVLGTGGATTGNSNTGIGMEGGATITSAGGNVSVTGNGGGSGSGSGNEGIFIKTSNGGAGTITAGSSGTVTVVGTGAATSGGNNNGVDLSQSPATITSSGGNVSVTGNGGGTGSGSNNYGIIVSSSSSIVGGLGGTITAGSSGTVTVIGNGASTTGNNNYGVTVNGHGAQITSGGGSVNVTGIAGGTGSGSDHYGVYVNNSGKITSSGTGIVTVSGTGANTAGNNNYGVQVTDSSFITSAGGNVNVTGNGGGSSSSGADYGIYVQQVGVIQATGSGTVTVNGTAGNSTGNSNIGVNVSGSGSIITSAGGNVSVTGNGGGTASSQQGYGVYVQSSGVISASGTGTVSVTGTGGSATVTDDHGVYLNGGGGSALITSAGGNITVTGTNGVNSADAADILLFQGGAVTSTGTGGDITFNTTSAGTFPNTGPATDVSTGATKTLSFGANSNLNIVIGGTNVNSQYQQLAVVGKVNLTNTNLTFNGYSYAPTSGNQFIIVDNDGADPIIGTFNGLPEGATISGFLGSCSNATITYVGGTGNDVVITVAVAGATTFTWEGSVNDDWYLDANWNPNSCSITGNDNVVIPNVSPNPFPVINGPGNAVVNNITINPGASLTLSNLNNPALTVNGDLTNGGTFVNNSNSNSPPPVVNGNLTNNGIFTNSGTFMIGGNLTNNNNFTNNGQVQLGGILTNTSNLTNNNQMQLGGNLVNSGTVANNGGEIDFSGDITNTGNQHFGFGFFVFFTGGNVTLNNPIQIDGGVLAVFQGNLVTNGNLTLNDDAQLLHGAGSVINGLSGTVTGNITVKRTGRGNGTNLWNYWGSPVTGATSSILGGRKYFYDPTSATNPNTTSGLQAGWKVASGPMTAGKGYISQGAGVVSFTGPVDVWNSGPTVTTPVVTGVVPYNMLGNPFPTTLDANEFMNANGPGGTGILTGDVWFWDDDATGGSGYSNSDFALWNYLGSVSSGPNTAKTPDGGIAIAQGFFVEATTNGNVQFNNGMRIPLDQNMNLRPGVFFRQQKIERVYINVSNTHDLYNEVLVGFLDGATDGYDMGYDAKKMRGNDNIALYTKLNGRDFMSQALPPVTAERVVELGLDAGLTGTYTLRLKKIENMDETAVVLLEDRLTSTWQNLRVDTSYDFTVTTPGTISERFFLHFNPALEIATTDESCDGQDASITFTQGGAQYWNYLLTDANGNVVRSEYTFNGTVAVQGLQHGNYTLALSDRFGYQVTKTIIVNALQKVTPQFVPSANTVFTDETITFTNSSVGATQYTWDFGDGSQADTVASPAHSYSAEGAYVVQLRAWNQDCAQNYYQTINVQKLSTGVNAVAEDGISIFTFEHTLNVNFDFLKDEKGELRVYDVLGQNVCTRAVQTTGSYTVELKNAVQGNYVVQVVTKEKTFTSKVYLGDK